MKSWVIFPFEHCIENVKNTRKIPTSKFKSTGDFPIVSQEQGLVNGYWDNQEDVIKVNKPIVVFGDHTKSIKYVDFSFVKGADGTKVLLPKSFINSKFFYYQLMSIKLPELGYARHYKHLKRTSFCIPDYESQKLIVSKLDQAFQAIDQAIANTEKNIENLDELERSHLNGIFDTVSTESVLKYLPEISENLDRQRIPITKRDRVNGEIPYYGASGIVDYVSDHLFDERLLCISEDGANLLARKYPIAFQISGKTWVNNHAHVLRFKDIHLERFVMHYLNHIKLDSFISGMAQPKLNQAKLNKIPIPIPKIRKVEEICLKIERLNVLTSEMRMVQTEKLESMKQLKMSILEKAFKGELV